MEPLSSTELAAYVAGRLPAERMRAITRRAEADPELAARIYVVQELAGHIEEIRTWWAGPSPQTGQERFRGKRDGPPTQEEVVRSRAGGLAAQAPLSGPGPGPRPDLAPSVAAEKCSVFEEAEKEALRDKWIESEKTGHDLGEAAIRRWVQCHWWDYLKARWLEHLQGKRFWVELDRGDFGLLQRQFHDQAVLLDRILDRLKTGQENLDIICWAQTSGIPVEPVLQILEALDINSRRLARRFDPLPDQDRGMAIGPVVPIFE